MAEKNSEKKWLVLLVILVAVVLVIELLSLNVLYQISSKESSIDSSSGSLANYPGCVDDCLDVYCSGCGSPKYCNACEQSERPYCQMMCYYAKPNPH